MKCATPRDASMRACRRLAKTRALRCATARERVRATCRATLHTEEMLDLRARMLFHSRDAFQFSRSRAERQQFADRLRRRAPNRLHGLRPVHTTHPRGRHDRGIQGREAHGRCRLRVRRELRNPTQIASGVLLPRNKPGKVVTVPPAKKSTRKAAAKRKAPAKRKAARKTTAKRKAPAKRKATKKAAKRKAPAKRKAAKKATKRKAPAKRKAAKKRPAKRKAAKRKAPAKRKAAKKRPAKRKAAKRKAPAKRKAAKKRPAKRKAAKRR